MNFVTNLQFISVVYHVFRIKVKKVIFGHHKKETIDNDDGEDDTIDNDDGEEDTIDNDDGEEETIRKCRVLIDILFISDDKIDEKEVVISNW